MEEFYYLSQRKDLLPEVKEIFDKYFRQFGKNYLTVFDNLSDTKKDKLLKISFFYYWRGWKFLQSDDCAKTFDRSAVLISLISVIETIMSVKHKDFYEWYKSESNKKSSNVEILWNDYLEIYGSSKKMREFFEKYLDKDDKNYLINNIYCCLKNGQKNYFKEIRKIADWFYAMRSEFVHNSEYVPIPDGDYLMIGISVCGKYYFFEEYSFKKIISILEKSVAKYFFNESLPNIRC